MATDKTWAYSTNWLRFLDAAVRRWRSPMMEALNKQMASAVAALQLYGREYVQAHIDTLVLPDALRRIIVDMHNNTGVLFAAKSYDYVRGQLTRAEQREVDAAMQRNKATPLGFSERILAFIQGALRVDQLQDVTNMTDTTKRFILGWLYKMQAEALTVDEVIKGITNEEVTKARAELIVRTETVKASNIGAFAGAQASGVETDKEWISAQDFRVRHDHAEVDGQRKDMFDTFNVGGYPMQYPGDRGQNGNTTPAKEICNCRCSVAYRVKRDAQGKPIVRQNTALVSPPSGSGMQRIITI